MEQDRQKKERVPWLRPRHRVVRNIAYAVLYPYTKLKYNIKIEPFREQGDRAYLILMNHQTAFDQFFVGMTFRGPVYYVASEDLFSNGWISSLLRWLVAPIPIKKQTSDVAAVKNCVRVAKEGGTIAIAPEGNRTYSGRTGYMNPAIASLTKLIKLPVALLRIEGGYGVHPRWSDVVRRGKMRAYVSRVIEPEEYAGLSKSELFSELLRRYQKPDREKMFVLDNQDGRILIEYDAICFFEARNKKIYLNTGKEEYGFYGTIEQLEQELGERFLRCHRSFLVNRGKIERTVLSRNLLLLEGGFEIPVSRTYRPMMRQLGGK